VRRDSECQVCGVVAGYVVDELPDGPTDDQAITAVSKACSDLEEVVAQDDCDDFVDNYGAKLVELVGNGSSLNEICASLGLC
jgi:hypothetical protein